MLRHLAFLALAVVITAATAPVSAQSVADAALLRLDDLPAGWSLTGADTPVGTGAVGDECGAGPPVVPVSSAVAQFQAGPDGPFLIHSIAVFAPGDVERAWAYLVEDWSGCGGTRPEDPPFSPLPIPGLGDYRITRELILSQPPVSARLQVAIWRRGDAIATINLAGDVARGGVETALIERLARLVDQRLLHPAAGKGS